MVFVFSEKHIHYLGARFAHDDDDDAAKNIQIEVDYYFYL